MKMLFAYVMMFVVVFLTGCLFQLKDIKFEDHAPVDSGSVSLNSCNEVRCYYV